MVSLSKNQDWSNIQDPKSLALQSALRESITAQDTSSKTIQHQEGPAKIECHWAKQQDTQFLVIAASDTYMQQLRLPNVDRVQVSQTFEATATDELTFDFITAFLSFNRQHDWNTLVEAELTNLDTNESTTLLSRNLAAPRKTVRGQSRQLENIQYTIPQAGRYELRITQQLRGSGNPAKFQLWIHDAQLNSHYGTKRQDLLSISSLATTTS